MVRDNNRGNRSNNDRPRRGGFRSGGQRGQRRGGPRNSRGRGGARGRGARRGGFRGGQKVQVRPYSNFEGVYLMRDKNEAILTKSIFPGESVYGEKRVTVEENGKKIEYRTWNPYRSKIGAFIVAGSNILGF